MMDTLFVTGGIVEKLKQRGGPATLLLRRGLDAEIAGYLGHQVEWRKGPFSPDSLPMVTWSSGHPRAGETDPCPPFTTSLDAAVSAYVSSFSAPTALVALSSVTSKVVEDTGSYGLDDVPRLLLVDLVETVEYLRQSFREDSGSFVFG